jgi:hypothetical protein
VASRTAGSPRFAGALVQTRLLRLPPLPGVPRVPVVLVVRRDQRFTPGWLSLSRCSKMNATFVAHGNPRAAVTQRAAPVAVVTLRIVG